MIPFGPWAPDQPRREGVIVEARNVIPRDGNRYQSLPTVSTISVSAVSGTPLAGFSSRNVGGASKTYVATSTGVYERSAAGWTDITTTTHTVADTDRWEITQYNDDIIFASHSLTLQRQPGGNGNLTIVTGAPAAACIANVRQFVIAADIGGASPVPHRVQWCAIDDPTDWAASEATQAGTQDMDSRDGRVMAVRGGEFGLILQQNAISRMTYVGAPIVWQFDKIDSRNGCEVSGSAVLVGRVVYFLSQDGWRATDGSGESVNIGDGFINEWFSSNLKTSKKYKIRGAYHPAWRCVVWTFPSYSGAGDNDSLLIYSLEAKRWARGTYGQTILWEGASEAVTLDGLDPYFSSLDDVTPPLDDPLWLGGEPVFCAMENGLLTTLGNTAGTALINTSEFQTSNNGKKARLQYVEPVIDSTTVNVRVRGRQTVSDPAEWTPYAACHSRTGRAPFRTVARYHGVGVRITGDFDGALGINVISREAGTQ